MRKIADIMMVLALGYAVYNYRKINTFSWLAMVAGGTAYLARREEREV